MSAGSGALGFGSGLAKGFAQGYLRNQDLRREKEEKQRQRDLQEFQATFPIIFQQGQETGDYSNVNAALFRVFPDLEKRFKKEGSPFEMLAPVLARNPQQATPDQRALRGEQDSAVAAATGTPVALPSTNALWPGTPPPAPDPKRMLLGIQMPTQEERLKRDVTQMTALEKAKLTAQDQAKLDQAARIRALDPTMSVPASLAAVGYKVEQDEYGVVPSGGGIYKKSGPGAGVITEAPSAKLTSIPGQFGQRVMEIAAQHPDWAPAQVQAEAAKAIASDRTADDQRATAGAEMLNETRRLNLELAKRNNAATLTPVQARLADGMADNFVRDSKEYVARLDAYHTVVSASKEQTPGSDLALVFAFMKMIDPGSTVREGERAIVENSTNVPDRIRNMYNRITEGVRLTPEQRKDLANQAKAQFTPFQQRQKAVEAQYRRRAESVGIPADNVVLDYGGDPGGSGGPRQSGLKVTYTNKAGQTVTTAFPNQAAADEFFIAAGGKK